jgi:hypothetical protein
VETRMVEAEADIPMKLTRRTALLKANAPPSA